MYNESNVVIYGIKYIIGNEFVTTYQGRLMIPNILNPV